jgi:outer membrane protein OmpA-like peptidoglycan-associated protein/ABC-type taurine transport system substrate-binding protein
MSEKRAKRVLLMVFIYLLIIGAGGAAWKFIFNPLRKSRIEKDTGSETQYKHTVNIALDSFSGYAILRSEEFTKDLKRQGIRIKVKDDKADYKSRIRALQDGDVELAVFTVDSFLVSGSELGEFPASIILVIDESRGADAIISYKKGLSNLQDLDSADSRFVLTPNSPSEFLARVVIADLNLANLSSKWIKEADGAMDVRKKFRAAKQGDKTAYVLWEPALSMALKEKGAHVLLDSSHLKGYIMDVIVARREFLIDNHDVAKAIVASYLRSVYYYSKRDDGMIDLVVEDSSKSGMKKMDEVMAENLVDGVLWKNTMENYAHFGLVSSSENKGLNYIEDIIDRISQVLIVTEALSKENLPEDTGSLYYDKILRELKSESFHPGKKLNILKGKNIGVLETGKIRGDKDLPALTKGQWAKLEEIGEMRIDPLSFARGTARINISSKRNLNTLAERLKSWPTSYLRVIGHARAEGDPEANRILSLSRSEAAMNFLLSKGISKNRIRAEAAEPSQNGGGAQSVSFVLGHVPY